VSLIPFSLRKLGKGFQAVVQEAKVVCLAFKLTCLILLGESTITYCYTRLPGLTVSPPTLGRSNTLDTVGKIRTERPLDHYTMEHLLTPLVRELGKGEERSNLDLHRPPYVMLTNPADPSPDA